MQRVLLSGQKTSQNRYRKSERPLQRCLSAWYLIPSLHPWSGALRQAQLPPAAPRLRAQVKCKFYHVQASPPSPNTITSTCCTSQNDIFVFCLFVWILGAQRLCLLYFYCLEACSAYFSESIDKWRYRWAPSEGRLLRSFSATLLTCADSYPPSPSLRIYSAPSLYNWHGLTSPFICSSQLYRKRCPVITLHLIL